VVPFQLSLAVSADNLLVSTSYFSSSLALLHVHTRCIVHGSVLVSFFLCYFMHHLAPADVAGLGGEAPT
jgi:hypothetical protein